MAIIYSYPFKAAALADTVVITDSETVDPKKKTKKTSVSSIRDAILPVDNVTGTGTAGTIPKWSSDGSTLTDSIIKDQGGLDVLIPRFIKHDGDNNNFFGFNDTSSFLVYTESDDQESFRITPYNTTIKTDGTIRLKTSSGGTTAGSISLYYNGGPGANDNEKLRTDPDGILVKAWTAATPAAGRIRFGNDSNDGYIGISGPLSQGSTNDYTIVLPAVIGQVGQVLAIASINGSNAIMEWADNSGGGGGSFAGNAASGLPLASAGSPLASGATV